MPISNKDIAQVIVQVVNRHISESYARQTINAFPEQYTITRHELYSAYKEAYTYLYNEDVKQERARLPCPSPDKSKGGSPKVTALLDAGFWAAAKASLDWLHNYMRGKGKIAQYAKDGKQTAHTITILLPKGNNRNFFSEMKTAGIKEVFNAVREANGLELKMFHELVSKPGGTYEGDAPRAFKAADDILMRRLIHRVHTGETTTGLAAISGRLQAYQSLTSGFGQLLESGVPNKDITAIFKSVDTSFKWRGVKKGQITKIKATKDIELSVASYVVNLVNDGNVNRVNDLINNAKKIDKWAEEALVKVIEKGSLAQLKTLTSIDAVASAVGAMIGDTLVASPGVSYKSKPKPQETGGGTYDTSIKSGRPTLSKEAKIKDRLVSKWNYDKKVENAIRELLQIRNIINTYINAYVEQNMGEGGRLVYRTGRFANTIYASGIKRNQNGALSIETRYMRHPYAVFEGPGQEARDPRKLIQISIREILRDKLTKKLKQNVIVDKTRFRKGAAFPYLSKSNWKIADWDQFGENG